MSMVIKPEIYASYVPIGTVGLKPEIYISYIPAPGKAATRTLRKVTVSEKHVNNTNRQVKKSEKVSSDVLRGLVASEKTISDTKRTITVAETISGHTFRNVANKNSVHGDTWREVKATERAVGDTSRRMGTVKINGDLHREVEVSTFASATTRRQVGTGEKISADTKQIIGTTEGIASDTYRKVTNSLKVSADTFLKIGVGEKISADIKRIVGVTEKVSADTFRRVGVTEKTVCDIKRGLRAFAHAGTLRQVTRTEKAIGGTVIRVPHVMNYVVESDFDSADVFVTSESIVNTFEQYGATAVNITLSERTLSDNFQIEVCRPLEINDAVRGQLLDYPFHFLVEDTEQTEMRQSVKGRYNIDEQLYTWFYLPTPRINVGGTEYSVPAGSIVKRSDNKVVLLYPTATKLAHMIAGYLGLEADIKIDDFHPSNIDGDNKITYADLLSAVFSWTSRLPQRQINVFIRGGVLHCIQRGKEENVFDISDIPHSRPTVNKKLIRVLCFNPNKDSDDDDDDEGRKIPYTGTINFSTTKVSMGYHYVNGLLHREWYRSVTDKTADSAAVTYSSSVDYKYLTPSSTHANKSELIDNQDGTAEIVTSYDRDTVYYTASKKQNSEATEYADDGSVTVTKTVSSTNYEYRSLGSEVYLFAEHEDTTVYEYTKGSGSFHVVSTNDITEHKSRDTYHVPVGNGWYAQQVYENGVFMGANLSQGAPGNSVSQYMVNQIQRGWTSIEVSYNNYGNQGDELSSIVDDSFPVRDAAVKAHLNEDLRWLHRKIQETVTVDLTPEVINGVPRMKHVVDFTERVRLDGKEYYLVSNKIMFTPRKFVQKLQLVRWY